MFVFFGELYFNYLVDGMIIMIFCLLFVILLVKLFLNLWINLWVFICCFFIEDIIFWWYCYICMFDDDVELVGYIMIMLL